MITEPDGQIHQPSEHGLFYRDTRLMSTWAVEVNGHPWQPLSSASTDAFACQIVMSNPALPTDRDGDIKKGTVSLTLARLLGLSGLRETITLRNHNRSTVRLALTIRVGSDFGDIFDVKSHKLVSRGETQTRWLADAGVFETVHTNDPFRRGISIGPVGAAPKPVLRDGQLSFLAEIAPQGVWTTELDYRVIDGEALLDGPAANFAGRADSVQARDSVHFQQQAVRLRTPHIGLLQLYHQSLDDLAALRLPFDGTAKDSFVPAAGIPWFAALFGRDSIVTAIQTVPIYPDFARGALTVLARYQADGRDDSRDMQPGKIPHELRRGEMAQLGLVPYRPYYGTADATPLYIVLLHHAWRYTGDDSLLHDHLETAERCLGWIDHDGDMDGDGFQEYQRRTPDGAENQGWKDSGNGVLDENGDDVPAPKALCELQGYVFDAWRRMAEIYDGLGRPGDASRMRDKAVRLRDRFNDVFWDEAAGFYALCLDPAKRPVMSVTSNPGHLLWSGIVPPDRAERVVRRLLADDMFSGWGVRTLAASHPAYNPHDYQLGAIWPHDNGLIATGMKQYGFHVEAAMIAQGLIDASARFQLNQLPEVFAGTSRHDSPFPVQYLGANVPQAWAAGSVFMLLHAILGLNIDVPGRTLFIDANLPDWLEEISLEGIRVGTHSVDLRVWRDGERTRSALVGGAGVTLQERTLGSGPALS